MELSKTIQDKLNEGRQYRDAKALDVVEEEKDEEMIVEGYASTFNEEYKLYDDGSYSVFEQIDPSAFAECDMSDVIMQYDHEGRVLARTRNNTLTITTDEHGLKVRADLSKSALGKGLYEDIKNGIVDRMSFGFTVDEDKLEEIEDFENKSTKVLRTITKVGKLYDVSAVSFPANEGTEISARKYSTGVVEEIQAERLAKRNKENARRRLEIKLKMLGE